MKLKKIEYDRTKTDFFFSIFYVLLGHPSVLLLGLLYCQAISVNMGWVLVEGAGVGPFISLSLSLSLSPNHRVIHHSVSVL